MSEMQPQAAAIKRGGAGSDIYLHQPGNPIQLANYKFGRLDHPSASKMMESLPSIIRHCGPDNQLSKIVGTTCLAEV